MHDHACDRVFAVTAPTHLIVPFAQVLSVFGQDVWQRWGPNDLPHLRRLLRAMQPGPVDGADEMSWTPPHERVLARAYGWPSDDGIFPWAAQEIALKGWGDPSKPWGRITPVHWQLGTEQVRMAPPESLQLDDGSSNTLFEAVRDLFESEGFELRYADPLTWLASHPSLADLPCASLDRVSGRSVEPWMRQDPQSRLLRRLQNEVQMLLYRHPLNEAREAQGLLPINSFWLSATGRLRGPVQALRHDILVADDLREPALNEDALAWQAAWQRLDAEILATWLARCDQGEDLQLTLCGERGAQTWRQLPLTWTQRVARWWRGSNDLRWVEDL